MLSMPDFRNNHHFVLHVREEMHRLIAEKGVADIITTNSAQNLTKFSALYLKCRHGHQPTMQLIPSPKQNSPTSNSLLGSKEEILESLESKLRKYIEKLGIRYIQRSKTPTARMTVFQSDDTPTEQKTELQSEIVRLIKYLLDSKGFKRNLKLAGFREIINIILRMYPEITSNNERTWKKVELYKKHFKITERAVRVIDNYTGLEKDLWTELHYEHILPISSIIDKFFRLTTPTNIDEVEKMLKEHKVVILSKEEANVLDGRLDKYYPLEGQMVKGKGLKSKGIPQERLDAIGARIDSRYSSNFLH